MSWNKGCNRTKFGMSDSTIFMVGCRHFTRLAVGFREEEGSGFICKTQTMMVEKDSMWLPWLCQHCVEGKP